MIRIIIIVLGLTLCSFTDKEGIASRYANKFEGRRTASGDIYRKSKITAASNFFKLGSLVRVTDILSGRYVEVKINDRMHPKMARKGRVVDLSTKAAQIIGLTGLRKVIVKLI